MINDTSISELLARLNASAPEQQCDYVQFDLRLRHEAPFRRIVLDFTVRVASPALFLETLGATLNYRHASGEWQPFVSGGARFDTSLRLQSHEGLVMDSSPNAIVPVKAVVGVFISDGTLTQFCKATASLP